MSSLLLFTRILLRLKFVRSLVFVHLFRLPRCSDLGPAPPFLDLHITGPGPQHWDILFPFEMNTSSLTSCMSSQTLVSNAGETRQTSWRRALDLRKNSKSLASTSLNLVKPSARKRDEVNHICLPSRCLPANVSQASRYPGTVRR